MPLPVVAVHRSFAQDVRREILGVGGRRGDDPSWASAADDEEAFGKRLAAELTLIATDRPFLFASVSGPLAAWGMAIASTKCSWKRGSTAVSIFSTVRTPRPISRR